MNDKETRTVGISRVVAKPKFKLKVFKDRKKEKHKMKEEELDNAVKERTKLIKAESVLKQLKACKVEGDFSLLAFRMLVDKGGFDIAPDFLIEEIVNSVIRHAEIERNVRKKRFEEL